MSSMRFSRVALCVVSALLCVSCTKERPAGTPPEALLREKGQALFGGKIFTWARTNKAGIDTLAVRIPEVTLNNAQDAGSVTIDVPTLVRETTVVRDVYVGYDENGSSPHPHAPPYLVVRLFTLEPQDRTGILCGNPPHVDQHQLPSNVHVWGARPYCQAGIGSMAWPEGGSNVVLLGTTTKANGAEFSYDAGSIVSLGLFINIDVLQKKQRVIIDIPEPHESWSLRYPTRATITFNDEDNGYDVAFTDWVSPGK